MSRIFKGFKHIKIYSNLCLYRHKYGYFCTSTMNNNQNLLDLLNENMKEELYTDNKLPEIILDELTKGYKRPELPRISKYELYGFLQNYNQLLIPYVNILNHFIVHESKIKDEYNDPNIVKELNDNESNDNIEEGYRNELNDDDLIVLMNEEYLGPYKDNPDSLYDTAMNFYDISNTDKNKREIIYKNNRLASIFLSLASNLNHVQAQCMLY